MRLHDLTHQELHEFQLPDHKKVLMPIVKGLMNTAARPLIYKVWQKSPKAVLALAAVKKLHDQGDDNPFTTLTQLTDVGVPISFLKRLAYDAGLTDIPGVRKVSLMPAHALEDDDEE